MDYQGVIIEESLENKDVLNKLKIVSTRIEKINDRHKTPWLKQWTLHTVEVPEEKAQEIVEEISESLDSEHDWYADFQNGVRDFIIFKNKIFCINKNSLEKYGEAREYGISLGIPEYQVSFSHRADKLEGVKCS